MEIENLVETHWQGKADNKPETNDEQCVVGANYQKRWGKDTKLAGSMNPKKIQEGM